MEPFSIHCTTCKTRLKVRDESAIGQLLACPKCSGMILVKRPEGPAPHDSAETRPDLSAAVKPPAPRRPGDTLPANAFDDIDSILSDAPPKPRSKAPGAPSPNKGVVIRQQLPAEKAANENRAAGLSGAGSGSSVLKPSPAPGRDAPSGSSSHILSASGGHAGGSSVVGKGAGSSKGSAIGRDRAQGESAGSSIVRAESTNVATAPPVPGSEVVDFDELSDASPRAESPWRYWSMLAVSLAAGVALAIGVVAATIIWLSRNPSDEPVIAKNSTPPRKTAAVDPTAVETPLADAVPAVPPADEPPAPAAPPESEPNTPAAAVKSPEPAAEQVAAAPAPPAPMKEPAPIADKPVAPAGDTTSDVASDPLGMIQPPAATPPAGNRPPAKINDPLAKFGALIEGANSSPLATENRLESDAPAQTSADEPASPRRPSLPRPAPREVDVTARLADPLPSIEVSSVPLVDFVRFVQDLSTVPITVEPDGLWFTRSSLTTPVSLKGTNVTVGQALADALKPLGLEHVIVDGQLSINLVRLSPAPTIKYPIQDLTGGDEAQAAELAEWCRTLVEPQSWGAEGDADAGSLVVTADSLDTRQQRAVHARLLSLFERLRVARGLKPASRFDAALFALETRSERIHEKLVRPISLNFSQPTPFQTVLDRLGEAADVRIVVDWKSLAAVGWNPDGEATLVASKQPFGEALTTLVESMDLTWRAIDGQTIQVLAPQSAAERLELEFYNVGPLVAEMAEPAELLTRLQTAVGETAFREAGGHGDLRYDVASKHIIASLPQQLQRKLADEIAKFQSAAESP